MRQAASDPPLGATYCVQDLLSALQVPPDASQSAWLSGPAKAGTAKPSVVARASMVTKYFMVRSSVLTRLQLLQADVKTQGLSVGSASRQTKASCPQKTLV